MYKLQKPPKVLFRALGKLATELKLELEHEHAGYNDVAAFGAPSECNSLVASGAMRARRQLIEDYAALSGFTVRELEEQFDARVSAKWLYQSGIMTAFGEYRDEQDAKRYEYVSRLPRGGYDYA